MENFLVERKKCSKCSKDVVRLVNEDVCIICYQSDYYKRITKKKRKNKKGIYHILYGKKIPFVVDYILEG